MQLPVAHCASIRHATALDKAGGGAQSRPRSGSRREGVPIILGIGSDLASIERIGRTIDRFGPRFLNRVFTPVEQATAERRAQRVATYAKRWAAKEACSKALGTGLRMGIAWKDMGVFNWRGGQPGMRLTGWADARLAEMTPPGMRAIIHLTLTDDHPWAQAFVVIEALPLDQPGARLPEAEDHRPRA